MAQLKDLLVTGASNFIGPISTEDIQLTKVYAPTSAGGATYSIGSANYVLASNGTSGVYWKDSSAGTIDNVSVDWSQQESPSDSLILTIQVNSTSALAEIPQASSNTSGIISTGAQEISGIKTFRDTANFNQIPTSPTPNEDSNNTSVATTEFVKRAFTVNEAMLFKGGITPSSTSTNGGALTEPAERGWTYKSTDSGYINGILVEPGDTFIATTAVAAATSENYATIQNSWLVIQANIDGYVIGPPSSTAGGIAFYSGTNGKAITNDNDFSWDETNNILTAEKLRGYVIVGQTSTNAIGKYATAEGTATNASGTASHAEGDRTIASEWYAHAEGYDTEAEGEAAHAEGIYTVASGDYSHAEGYKTATLGYQSHAEGNNTRAQGHASHSEGTATYAKGIASHAEGYSTTALSDYSHAEGRGTVASGVDSHAEGYNTTASATYSHTEGSFTVASKIASHAEGGSTTASGYYSHAEGLQTVASEQGAHAEGYKTIAGGGASHAEGYNTTASGADSHTEGSNTTASESDSHAEGNNTIASGGASHAEGYITVASQKASHAEGQQTVASEIWAHAEGCFTTASGTASHAEGYGATASGYVGHAEGHYTIASNTASHAEGWKSTASGPAGHAEGYETIASEMGTHTEGYKTTASGTASHAEGVRTIASATATHAEGFKAIASGASSHAEGFSTTASGDYSHTEGSETTASATASHAEGQATTASGSLSHAQGNKTIANHKSQFVFGEFNIVDNSTATSDLHGNYIEIVGNGISTTTRSNARTLDWSGNESLAGNLLPMVNNSQTIGSTTATWKNINIGTTSTANANGVEFIYNSAVKARIGSNTNGGLGIYSAGGTDGSIYLRPSLTQTTQGLVIKETAVEFQEENLTFVKSSKSASIVFNTATYALDFVFA